MAKCVFNPWKQVLLPRNNHIFFDGFLSVSYPLPTDLQLLYHNKLENITQRFYASVSSIIYYTSITALNTSWQPSPLKASFLPNHSLLSLRPQAIFHPHRTDKSWKQWQLSLLLFLYRTHRLAKSHLDPFVYNWQWEFPECFESKSRSGKFNTGDFGML